MTYKKYLFHIHTRFTDGASTVAEYCAHADMCGYQVVVFTEHVRRDLDYDWLDYLEAIGRARMMWPGLEIWCGCEVKVLLDGSLDMPDYLPSLDMVCIAEHGDYGDRRRWEGALQAAFKVNVGLPLVWVHPFRWLVAQERDVDDVFLMNRLIRKALASGVLLESISERIRRLMGVSAKLGVWRLDVEIVDAVAEEHRIIGQDAHSVDDIVSEGGV